MVTMQACSDNPVKPRNDFVVSVPDPALEECLRTALGKPEGDLLASELYSLKILNAENLNITNLSGLQHCERLEAIYLNGNNIVDITPLSSLRKLEKLHLYDNNIEDICPLSGISSLRELRLGVNDISSVDALGRLNMLKQLFLNNNNIESIDSLRTMIGLQNLVLYGNRINNIEPLAYLTNLRFINLYSNDISDLNPLNENGGIGSGDTVILLDNPLSQFSIDSLIPSLQTKGVTVIYHIDSISPKLQVNKPGLLIDSPDHSAEPIRKKVLAGDFLHAAKEQ